MIRGKASLVSALVVVLASVVAGKALCSSTVAPKAYAIAEINVTDTEAYRQYIAAVSPIVEQFGGRYLVRAGTVVPIEG
jgi:phage-related protein